MIRAIPVVAALAACGHAPASQSVPPGPARPAAVPIDAPVADAAPASQDEQLAAIQKAMNDLVPAVQACWAAAAVVRFDIEGRLVAQIDIARGSAHATLVSDTAKNAQLAACVTGLVERYPWAPPLAGQTIQLPFEFHAPDGQSVVDRQLVPWAGQGQTRVAVLLDQDNTGTAAASLFELALAAGGTTGARTTDRAELWFFLGDAKVEDPGVTATTLHAGDMMYVPATGERAVTAAAGADVHAVIVAVPGGREGSARAGALPTPTAAAGAKSVPPMPLPATGAKAFGPATIFLDPVAAREAVAHNRKLNRTVEAGAPMAASILRLPAGANVPEHVHAKETELLYVLEGAGTMTIGGVAVAISPTSVISIPPNTKHAFSASAAVRALQIYTPAGPEQRFKKPTP